MRRQQRLGGKDWQGICFVFLALFGPIVLVQFCLPQIRSDTVVFGMLGLALIFCYAMRAFASGGFFRGLKAYRQCRFEDALPHFSTSHDFFTKHENLDRWRSVLFFAPTRPRLRTMALAYQAFCCTQLNRGDKAIELYEKAIREDPNYAIPELMLRALRSAVPQAGTEEER